MHRPTPAFSFAAELERTQQLQSYFLWKGNSLFIGIRLSKALPVNPQQEPSQWSMGED